MTEALTAFHFLRPALLWLLLPVALAWLWQLQRPRRAGSWETVIDPQLLPHLIEDSARSEGKRLGRWLVPAAALAVIASAGPAWERLPQPVLQKQDALVVVLDLSYSMRAQDIAPSRADRARRKLRDLLELRQEGQTALIAYAGDPHIVTPLTDDNPTIANLLPALSPDMMPLPGSDATSAVAMAQDLLRSAGVPRGRILLVTDGIEADAVDAIAELVAERGDRLSILGVGTAAGAPIPLPAGGFLKDPEGTIVIPSLEPEPLEALADRVSGRYREITVDDTDLAALTAPAPSLDEEATQALDRTADAWVDAGYLFAIPLVLVLLGSFRRGWIYVLAPCLLFTHADSSHAEGWRDWWLTPDQQGRSALERGDPAAASELFEDPAWKATAAYRAQDYETAVAGFARADDADGWYNRGNALARAGELEAAIDAYERSLALSPGREDAEENLALVRDLLQQQQQQQEQQQQDQQDQSSEGDQQQSQSQSQQGASDQDPSGSSQPQPSQQSQAQSDQQQDQESQQASEQQEQSDEAQDTSSQPSPGEQALNQPMPELDMSDMAEDLERDQAMQQWLRRIPDDPSGLLREKFRYESRQRMREGGQRDNEKVW